MTSSKAASRRRRSAKARSTARPRSRFGSLLNRSKAIQSFVLDPLVLKLVQGALGPHCDRFNLNLSQGIEIHPGAPAQFAHRDQAMWGGPKGSWNISST